jgi:hypothetical protein
MLPVSGLTAAMCHRDNEDIVGLNGVKHRIRKDSGKATPDIFVKRSPAVGVLQQAFNRLLHAHDEPQVQPGLALDIVVTSLVDSSSASG